MHLGICYRHNCHGLQFVLVCMQWEVDINFFGCRGTNMALLRKYISLECIKKKYDTASAKPGTDRALLTNKIKIPHHDLKSKEVPMLRF